jgi:copper ion binding protein
LPADIRKVKILVRRYEGRKDMEKKTYRVTGMGCEACVARVTKAVSALDGVSRAVVDLKQETLAVEYDESKVSFTRLRDAVDAAGYGLEES